MGRAKPRRVPGRIPRRFRLSSISGRRRGTGPGRTAPSPRKAAPQSVQGRRGAVPRPSPVHWAACAREAPCSGRKDVQGVHRRLKMAAPSRSSRRKGHRRVPLETRPLRHHRPPGATPGRPGLQSPGSRPRPARRPGKGSARPPPVLPGSWPRFHPGHGWPGPWSPSRNSRTPPASWTRCPRHVMKKSRNRRHGLRSPGGLPRRVRRLPAAQDAALEWPFW